VASFTVRGYGTGAARIVADRVRTSDAARDVTGYERFLKPVLDRVLALLLLVILAPIMLIVAGAVWISLGRPILFRQTRVGRGERLFGLHKFRTMAADRRHHNRRFGSRGDADRDRRVTHKHPDDPRLTPLGRMLRKWSVDELPQLWDVVTGKLSLVGPRPELTSIVDRYEPWQHGRHAVKPGLTGLWQVTARGDGPMFEHTDLDIEYAERVTFRRDLMILLRTIPAVLAHTGY
jgi:lipopolysaccharide/colanic/teichoic acid biosynthesis glycosyltransferase